MADDKIRRDKIDQIARLLSEHWSDLHTNEALGFQRMLATHVHDGFYLPTRKGEVDYVKEVVDERSKLAFGLGLCTGRAFNAIALANEVIAEYGDRVGTHYEGCWRSHVACFAVRIKEALSVPEAEEEPRAPQQ